MPNMWVYTHTIIFKPLKIKNKDKISKADRIFKIISKKEQTTCQKLLKQEDDGVVSLK